MPAIATFRNAKVAGTARSYGPLPVQRGMRELAYKKHAA